MPAAEIARRHAETLAARLGPDGRLDLVVLGLGADGELGALTPGCAALDSAATVAVVPSPSADEPDRVSLTPTAIARVGHVLVLGLGPQAAGTLARALREGSGPAARVPPSERATWIVDRDAAAELLRDATAVAE
jgi:6-phosphogluconolactonase